MRAIISQGYNGDNDNNVVTRDCPLHHTCVVVCLTTKKGDVQISSAIHLCDWSQTAYDAITITNIHGHSWIMTARILHTVVYRPRAATEQAVTENNSYVSCHR